MSLSSIANPLLRTLFMRQRNHIQFHGMKQLVQEHIPAMLWTCMFYLCWNLLATIIANFDLWMSRVGFGTFALALVKGVV